MSSEAHAIYHLQIIVPITEVVLVCCSLVYDKCKELLLERFFYCFNHTEGYFNKILLVGG